jgi:hypothetical protein
MEVIERRSLTVSDLEFREDDDAPKFRGHAAVFDQETDLGFFREQIAPGAFTKTIKDGADVRFLFNHDPDTVMARTTAKTLRLSEDKQGLLAEADLDPADVDVQRLLPKLRSGNVSQMSFAFRAVKEEWDDTEPDHPLRTLREVKLFDVSPVTYPAYEGTDAQLRAALDSFRRARGGPEPASFDALLERLSSLTPEEAAQVSAVVRSLTEPVTEPVEDDHSEDDHSFDVEHARRRLQVFRLRLSLPA